MGLLNKIVQNKGIVFVDSSPFIYFVEAKEPYAELLPLCFDAVDDGKIQVLTSTITCAEVLVVPSRKQNERLIDTYLDLLTSTPQLTVAPFDLAFAKRTAEFRAIHGLKTPDAIQWATAVSFGTRFFLTNDKRFGSLPGMEVLLMDDFIDQTDK